MVVTWLYPTWSSRGQELPVSPTSADQTAIASSELKGGLTNMLASVKLQK